jgi:hypothetical protein
MRKTWKALTGAALAAALVLAPMVATGALADEEVTSPDETVLVDEQATPVVVEPVVVEPVVEEPAPVEAESQTFTAPAVESQSKPEDTGQPDMICNEAGYEAKVDTTGDPATVTVTAPAGFLIDSYCVKAGTTKVIVPVTPPAATVVIDHPDKDSVSHYQVHLIPVPPVVLPVPALYSAEPTPPTCDVAGSFDFGATYPNVTVAVSPAYTGPGVYTLTITANPGYTFPEGQTVLTRTITVAGVLTGEVCDDEDYAPTCTTVTGSAVINGDGVLAVEGDWDTTSISVPFSGTLADIGTVLDIQATPIQYVGLHIRTAQGSISFEEEPSYGGNLWSGVAWDGVEPGMGYAAFGTIEEYIAENGDVVVTGIDLLYTHPDASSTTVTSFTIGCTTYTFKEEVVVPPTPEEPEFIDECGTDLDGYLLPNDTEDYFYVESEDGDTVTITAYNNDLDVLDTWTFTFTDEACPTTPPTTTPPAPGTPTTVTPPKTTTSTSALAVTGGPDMTLWAAGSLVTLLAGLALTVARRVRTQR